MMPLNRLIGCLLLCFVLAACVPLSAVNVPILPPLPTTTFTPFSPPTETATLAVTDTASPEPTATLSPPPAETLTPSLVPTATVTPLPAGLDLDPAYWHNWPVIPIVTERVRQIYLNGQTLGNDPHAFSVFGDCQSEPKVFLGPFETDAELLAGLPPELQETVAWFAGSFNRDGPTIRGGTTSGALLWPTWHQNKFTCGIYETPLQCELRIHKPAFVFVLVGTHYESHNDFYLQEVVYQLITAGVVPIMFSKADNREADESINLQAAQLAEEFDLPFWNFWATLSELENRGLYTRPDVPLQGDLYLTEEALAIHRLTGLQALDAVWRAVRGE